MESLTSYSPIGFLDLLRVELYFFTLRFGNSTKEVTNSAIKYQSQGAGLSLEEVQIAALSYSALSALPK
jgi:hypothetical protein